MVHVFPSSLPPPQRDDNRLVRGYYTRSQLSDAIRAVLVGKMKVAQSAALYGIPRPTLQKKVATVREEHRKAELLRSNQAAEEEPKPQTEDFSIREGDDDESKWRAHDQQYSVIKHDFLEEDMGVAEECEVTTEPSTSTATSTSASTSSGSSEEFRKRLERISSQQVPAPIRLDVSTFAAEADALNRRLPTSQRLPIPSINRIVIKNPNGTVLKQFVLEDDLSRTTTSPSRKRVHNLPTWKQQPLHIPVPLVKKEAREEHTRRERRASEDDIVDVE